MKEEGRGGKYKEEQGKEAVAGGGGELSFERKLKQLPDEGIVI